MIAARHQKKTIAPFHFEGYCDTTVVDVWAEECLAPCLKPGQVVILDNTSFHKASKIKDLVKKAGARVLHLPVYSPDLNPIENYWAVTKARIRKYRKPNQSLEEILDEVLCMS